LLSCERMHGSNASSLWLETILWLKLPFFTFLGAFTLYVLNWHQGRQPFSLFKVLNVDVSATGHPVVILLDIVISSILGTIIVVAITAPATIAQAVVAGLGMTGILSAHSEPK
jgi:hypothetical protein